MTTRPPTPRRTRLADPRQWAAALAAAALLTAGACSTNPATGRDEFTVMSPAQEQQTGAQEHPKILAEFGGVYDENPELNAYIAEIGGRIRAVSELPNQTFTFTLLDTDQVNAFALPGGYVYVTRGLVALANSEAELAGVIAHEIGHVTARHTANRVTTGVFAGLGAAVLGAVTGSQAIAQVANLGAQAYVQGYSRDQEFEADQLGVRYLARAGYDPKAMASFLGSLQGDSQLAAKIAGREGTEPEASLFSSHPRTPDRIQRAAASAEASVTGEPFEGRDVYLEHIQGTVYGDSPEQGYVRGRTFIHPRLDFRFDVPEGFRLQNGANAVVATRSDGAAIKLDGAKVASGIPMSRYLTDTWLAGAPVSALETIQVNGMEGATAATRGTMNQSQVDVRAVAIRFDGDNVFRFLFVTPANLTNALAEDFRRTTYSLRHLNADERAVKPMRVELVRVAAGDTVESLGNRMAFEDFPVERFRVLNGLQPGEGLQAGQLVKVVTE
jgi:predicted Zn-dependent protease